MPASRAEAIRTIALRDVLKNTPEYRVKWLHKWYSRKYFVSILEVENMPTEQLLQVWYEDKYQDLLDEAQNGNQEAYAKLEEEKQELCMSEEDREAENRARRIALDRADIEAFTELLEEEERSRQESAALTVAEQLPQTETVDFAEMDRDVLGGLLED